MKRPSLTWLVFACLTGAAVAQPPERAEPPWGLRAKPGTAYDDVTGLPREVVCERDGTEMVLVPGGEVDWGQEKRVLAPFYLDKYEVTNARFAAFVRAAAFQTGWGVCGSRLKDEWRWKLSHGRDEYPAANVMWFDVAGYCHWAGKRLPQELEWLVAAGELGGPRFPPPEPPHPPLEGPQPVGSQPDRSPCGAFDLRGNVCEWVAREPYFSFPVLLGGSWQQTGGTGLCSFCLDEHLIREDPGEAIGFRTVTGGEGWNVARDEWRPWPERLDAVAMSLTTGDLACLEILRHAAQGRAQPGEERQRAVQIAAENVVARVKPWWGEEREPQPGEVPPEERGHEIPQEPIAALLQEVLQQEPEEALRALIEPALQRYQEAVARREQRRQKMEPAWAVDLAMTDLPRDSSLAAFRRAALEPTAEAEARLKAVRGLAQRGDEASRQVCVELAAREGDDWTLRFAAVDVLKRAGDERATSAFQHVLRNLRAGGDEEARKIARDLAQKTASVGARRTAIALLREMGDKHLFAGLEEQALSTEDSPKRWAAIQAIAELDDPLAVPILGQVARGEDRKTMEVCTAVEGLGRIGTPAAAHELEEALPRHDDFWIGGRVIEALQAIGSETSIPILGRAALEKELPYHQGGHDVRRGAVQALGQYRNPAAARALEAALEAETVPDIREKAIAGLTNMDDEGSRPVLQRVACEPGFQKSVRTKAVESLAAIGGDAAVPSLQDVIRRAAEPDAAEVALRCLLQGPGEEALEFCRTLAQQSEDPQSRLNTACALRHAGEEQGAELVREITQDDTVPLSLRLRAAHSLLRRETQQLVEGVPPLTQDEEAMEAVCGALAGQTGSGYEVSLIWEIAEHLCESGWEPAAILGWQWVTLNSGHEEAAQRLAERGFNVAAHRGAITTWHLMGPFDNVPRNDLNHVFPPEQGIDLAASYPTERGTLSWRKYTTPRPLGCVLLEEVYGPWRGLPEKVVVYAFCTVTSPQPQAAELRVGASNHLLVWLNGQEVWRYEGYRPLRVDEDRVPVELPQGPSTLLLKMAYQFLGHANGWGFSVRFTQLNGEPVPDLRFQPAPE